MNKQELKWRAESDAYTLLEADAIKMDKGRLNKAKKEVSRIAKEKVNAGKAAQKTAKSLSVKKKASPKRNKKKK